MTFTRHVIFIDGYDPKGGRRVYKEQKKQVALYQLLSGQVLSIGTQEDGHSLRQTWALENASLQAKSRFDLLIWSDLVRKDWARTTSSMVSETIASLFEFVSTGRILHMWKLSRPLVCAAMLPFALAALAFAMPLLASWVTIVFLQSVTPNHFLAWLSGIAVFIVASKLAYKKLSQTPATWFSRVVAFARRYANEADGAESTSHYRERIDAWAQDLKSELAATQVDEILIVGYSAGSVLSTGFLSELVRLLPPEQCSKLALLTLGNCIPVAACLPAAHRLRQDLQNIAQHDCFWIDMTSPTDWGSVHGIDAVSVYTNMPQSPNRQQLSPRFHTLFTPANYEILRKDKYRVHQQYLHCTELLGENAQAYDYFALLCGPMSLRQRYASTPSNAI